MHRGRTAQPKRGHALTEIGGSVLAWCAPPCVHMCMYAAQREGACVRESHSALCSVLRRIPSLRGYIGSHRLPPGLGLNRRREAVTERGLCIYWQRGMFLSRHAIMLRTIMQGRLGAEAFAAVPPLQFILQA